MHKRHTSEPSRKKKGTKEPFVGPARTGTDSTGRIVPDTTGVNKGDCLKGGDHGQGSNPKEPATQTRGLPPVPSQTHTPMPPGRPLLNTVWKGGSSCAAIHTPKTGAWRAGAAPCVYRAAPSQRAQAPAPFPGKQRCPLNPGPRPLHGPCPCFAVSAAAHQHLPADPVDCC